MSGSTKLVVFLRVFGHKGQNLWHPDRRGPQTQTEVIVALVAKGIVGDGG